VISQGSEIGTLTRLQAEHLRNQCFIPNRVKKFIIPPQHPEGEVEHSPPSSAKVRISAATPPQLLKFFIMQVTSSCTTMNLGMEQHEYVTWVHLAMYEKWLDQQYKISTTYLTHQIATKKNVRYYMKKYSVSTDEVKCSYHSLHASSDNMTLCAIHF
jgi:hypothetical protein